MNLMERPRGRQLACRGGIISIPTDFPHTIQQIPRQLMQCEIMGIALYKSENHPKAHFKQYIRPWLVIEAAKLLVKTPLFRKYGAILNENWTPDQLEKDCFC